MIRSYTLSEKDYGCLNGQIANYGGYPEGEHPLELCVKISGGLEVYFNGTVDVSYGRIPSGSPDIPDDLVCSYGASIDGCWCYDEDNNPVEIVWDINKLELSDNV